MKAYLTIEGVAYQSLMAHLLPLNVRQEQAAFVIAHTESTARKICFAVTEIKLLGPDDFTSQEDDYLAMTDSTRVPASSSRLTTMGCVIDRNALSRGPLARSFLVG